MIKFLTGFLMLLYLSCPAAGQLEPYQGFAPTPALSLEDLGHKVHTLEDYRGRVVLVNFWASWCAPCLREMPSLQRLKEKLADKPFEILAINVGEPKYRVWKFVKLIDFHLTVPLDSREKTFESWGVKVLPTSFLLDKAGRVRYRVQGGLEWDDGEIVTVIEKLLADQD